MTDFDPLEQLAVAARSEQGISMNPAQQERVRPQIIHKGFGCFPIFLLMGMSLILGIYIGSNPRLLVLLLMRANYAMKYAQRSDAPREPDFRPPARTAQSEPPPVEIPKTPEPITPVPRTKVAMWSPLVVGDFHYSFDHCFWAMCIDGKMVMKNGRNDDSFQQTYLLLNFSVEYMGQNPAHVPEVSIVDDEGHAYEQSHVATLDPDHYHGFERLSYGEHKFFAMPFAIRTNTASGCRVRLKGGARGPIEEFDLSGMDFGTR